MFNILIFSAKLTNLKTYSEFLKLSLSIYCYFQSAFLFNLPSHQSDDDRYISCRKGEERLIHHVLGVYNKFGDSRYISISTPDTQTEQFSGGNIDNYCMDALLQKEYEAYLDAIDSYMMMKGSTAKVILEFEDRKRQEIVNQLQDISAFRYKLFGERIDEVDHEQDDKERDLELKRRIEQYNQVMRPAREKERRERRSRRQGEGRGQGHKRKIRTTITQVKLDEMNSIFSKFQQYRESHKDVASSDEEADGRFEYGSLKAIGEKLGLGYSTILHKYRQFRATKKVKGGALIAAMHHKRKYKKSREIENLIKESLRRNKFYTAVELSKFIEQNYGVTLSRSIISRHLGEMGYSYKNIKAKPVPNKNSPTVKEIRTQYALALSFMRERKGYRVLFLDECLFPAADYLQRSDYSQSEANEDVVVLLLVGEEGVVRSEVCVGPVLDAQYMLFLEGAAEDLKGEGREWLIALDMDNKIHTTEEMTQVRNLIRNDRVHLFFIPPNSYQMSAIEWLLPRLKQMVARRTYESTEELREAIQDNLRQIPLEMIQTCLRESEEYLTRGINSINF